MNIKTNDKWKVAKNLFGRYVHATEANLSFILINKDSMLL
jgi:hypothetical protein